MAAGCCLLLGAIMHNGELINSNYAVKIIDEAEGFIALFMKEWWSHKDSLLTIKALVYRINSFRFILLIIFDYITPYLNRFPLFSDFHKFISRRI